MAMHEPLVLVIGPAWVGDMVMAQSLFITLQQRGAVVDVLAPGWSVPLLARMPQVRTAVELPLGHGTLGLTTRLRVGRQLRAAGYTQAIVIPRSFKAALVPFFARIPRRTAYRGELRYGLINDTRVLDKELLSQTVQRYVALGLESDAALPPIEIPPPRLGVDSANQAQLRERFGITSERPLVGFIPGAEYGPAKRWPAASYAALARALGAQGYRVCLLGSARDAGVCAEINALADGLALDASGRTSLTDAVDLIAAMDWVVTNDSGLMHVAAAVGRPLVAIYGSSTPAYTPPLTKRAEVLYRGLECSPCFERECPLKHYNCLKQITVEEVMHACDRAAEHAGRDQH